MKKLLIGAALATMAAVVARADGYDEKLLAECVSWSAKVPTLRRDATIFEALAKRVKVKEESVRAFIRSILSSDEKLLVPIREINVDVLPVEIAAWIGDELTTTEIGGVDLDGDGQLEWIVDEGGGGRMGPYQLVLTRKNGNWKSVETFTGRWYPIKVEGRKGLGLVAVIRLGSWCRSYEYYEYSDGKWTLLLSCYNEDDVKHRFTFYEILGSVTPGD